MNLYEYLNVAKRVIAKHGNSYMLKSEDAISYVANFLMTADTRYTEGKGNREGFRSLYGRYAIKNWIKKYKKNKTISLESIGTEDNQIFKKNIKSSDNVIDNVLFNEVIAEMDKFNTRQFDCIRLYYFENQTLEAIGTKYDISKERVRQIIQDGLIKLKTKFNAEHT